jgi:phage regulator Rha-like protein
MTSLDIAAVTGKEHKNVLRAIREMEPAWEKERGLKFQPTQIRIGRQGEDRYENRVTITNIARWE